MAYNYGLASPHVGLLLGIVAYYFGPLGFSRYTAAATGILIGSVSFGVARILTVAQMEAESGFKRRWAQGL